MTEKETQIDAGHAALAIGDLPAAEAAFLAASVLDPADLDVWHALGMVQYKQSRYDEAITSGLRAVAIDPNDGLSWTSLSLAYMKSGKIPEAEAAAAKAKVISWGGKIKQG
jgi:tetratricopeptide (TPR) repeat protein